MNYYRLRSWIDPAKLDMWTLWCNPNENAINYINNSNYGDKINWAGLSLNPSNSALDILFSNIENIKWSMLSTNTNPRAIDLLTLYPEKIYFGPLCTNNSHAAIRLLLKYPKNIDHVTLSMNDNDLALDILESDYSKINYFGLAQNSNPRAIGIILANMDKIPSYLLCLNKSPHIINLLKLFPDKIDFNTLKYEHMLDFKDIIAKNPIAIDLLERHKNELDYTFLSMNPAIFTYDYEKIYDSKHLLHEELKNRYL